MDDTDKPTTINMLLDVSNLFGEPSKRLKPILICVTLISVPPFLWFNFALTTIPLIIFAPFFVIYVIRILMLTVGEEKRRVEQYKHILYDAYATPFDLMNITAIDEHGKVQYEDGYYSLLIVSENGSEADPLIRANTLRNIIDSLARETYFDIHIQNVYDTEMLFNRYDAIQRIKDDSVKKDYMDSIDYAISKTKEESSITRTIFVIRGKSYELKEIEAILESVFRNEGLKTYKYFGRATKPVIEDIIARDIDTYINFTDLLLQRYATGKYRGSEVIEYDITPDIADMENFVIKRVEEVSTTGFIPREEKKLS